MQRVLAARVNEARRLLEGDELSVDEIALRCGFGVDSAERVAQAGRGPSRVCRPRVA